MTDDHMLSIRVDETKIKIALATDLIVSLLNTIIHLKLGPQSPIDKKKALIDGYMQAWRNGLENQLEKIYISQVKHIQKTRETGMDDDVLNILIQVANTEGNIIRDEFVEEVRASLYKGLLGNVGV